MKHDLSHLNNYIVERGDDGGAWRLSRNGLTWFVIASWGAGWDHVSMSGRRTPTWDEMCWCKDLFFDSDESVVQFHPPKDEYINNHPHCLHLWRLQDAEFPMPPSLLVGLKSSVIEDIQQ